MGIISDIAEGIIDEAAWRAKVEARCLEVFGNEKKGQAWLETSNLALRGAKPKDCLCNSRGIKIILDELSRIEHRIPPWQW